MSYDTEIERLSTLVGNCFDKLSKYNNVSERFEKRRQHTSSSKTTKTTIPRNPRRLQQTSNGNKEPSTPAAAPTPLNNPPLPPNNDDRDAQKFSIFRNSITSIQSKFSLNWNKKQNNRNSNHEENDTNKSKRKEKPENHTRKMAYHLLRRYKHHFASLETFFTAYITKLEQKYTKNTTFPPVWETPDIPMHPSTEKQLVAEFDQYSHTVLAVDGIYWRADSLRQHAFFVKRNGKWFVEGINRIQARAFDYLAQYERIIALAPEGASRVLLMPLKMREKMQAKREGKSVKHFFCFRSENAHLNL
ncbi:674_t:CDS:1 [Ambispora gerdemannii]|uniref:674_t:CDS:1 n=1 Tax=Ambispora gerdemannii TaxID=144530 RepID=A0A9N9CNB1_9GLOM|nr:674_t:CDS:1 [Ambispora gerdemannii]